MKPLVMWWVAGMVLSAGGALVAARFKTCRGIRVSNALALIFAVMVGVTALGVIFALLGVGEPTP